MRERVQIGKGLKNLRRLLALQGLAFFALSLQAASSGGFTIRIRPVNPADVQAPAAVADLSATATVNEGQVILTWTSPADQPSGAVTAYELKYATYAVAGSTAAWWNGAASYALIGSYTPAAPGNPETFLVDGLPGGATYYFAVRSRDAAGNWSPLDNAAALGPQASAWPRFVRPAPVAGILALTNPDTSYNVNWNPVTQNEDGSAAADIADYIVRRSNGLTGPFSVVVSSGAGANSFSFTGSTAPVSVEYLKVLARDAAGNESDAAASNILEVTPQGIIGQIAVAPDGTLSRSYLPATLMGELRTSGGDLLLRVAPNADPGLNRDPRTLATYDVGFVSPVLAVDKNLTLSRPSMKVVLQYESPMTSNVPDDKVGALWWNGVQWIKMGAGVVDPVLNTVSFDTALPGTYQVRLFQAATELTLDKAAVFPRIFTPNGDGRNDVVYFMVENPRLSQVDGRIFDMSGGEVASLAPGGAGAPTPDTLVWNGKDKNGQAVPAGVYIYQVKGEGKTLSGTVVVAK